MRLYLRLPRIPKVLRRPVQPFGKKENICNDIRDSTTKETYIDTEQNRLDNVEFPGKIALVLPPGNVTGGALQLGCLLALRDTGLLKKVAFYAAGSVGAFNAAMAVTGRIEELKELWLSLKPKDVIRPKSLISVIYSNIAAWVAEILENWKENPPSFAIRINKPYYISKRVLILAIALALAVTISYPFQTLSFIMMMVGTILSLHLLRILLSVFLISLWYVFRRGSPKLLLGKFQKFLESPKLNVDSLNEFSFLDTVKEKVDLPRIQEEILQSEKNLVVAIVNATEWQLETYAFGQGKAKRIDVNPPVPIDPNLIQDIIFASASIPLIMPLYSMGENWYYDCGGLKPMPLSYAFDSDCDLIFVFINEPDVNKELMDRSRPITIFQTMHRIMEINQRERVKRELQIAAEKSKDVKTLHKMLDGINEAVENWVPDPETQQSLKQEIKKKVAGARFSFRHDKDIPIIYLCPPWNPSIEMRLVGGFKSFSLIPQLIERGYQHTMQVLQKERFIPTAPKS